MASYLVSAVVLSLLRSAQGGPIEIYKPSTNCTTANVAANAAVGSCNFNSYIALGDSYAAGINSQPDGTLPECSGSPYALQPPYCTSDECARNYGAYGWQFSQIYAPDKIQFMACSGADTGSAQALQVPIIQTLGNEDLITITIGGNNGNAFVTVVKDCVYGHLLGNCDSALAAAETTITTIGSSLDTLFDQIHGPQNPRIVVLGYAWFWPAGCSTCPFLLSGPTCAQKNAMNNLVTLIHSALAEAAAGHGFTFVNVNGGFEGHRLCDTGDPWFQWNPTGLGAPLDMDELESADAMDPGNTLLPLSVRGLFHPTAVGQMVYTQALEQALGCV